MITKEEFVSFIESVQDFLAKYDEINDNKALSENYFFNLLDAGFKAISNAILCMFTEEGEDWIMWWLIERTSPDYKAYDENDIEIPMNTVDDLWNYVKQYIK